MESSEEVNTNLNFIYMTALSEGSRAEIRPEARRREIKIVAQAGHMDTSGRTYPPSERKLSHQAEAWVAAARTPTPSTRDLR